MDEYIMTLSSDVEEESKVVNHPRLEPEEVALDPDFTFDMFEDPYIGTSGFYDGLADFVNGGIKPDPISVDKIISERRLSRKRRHDYSAEDTDDDSQDESDNLEEHDLENPDSAHDDSASATSAQENMADDHGQSSLEEDSETETQTERDRKAAFFDSSLSSDVAHDSFLSMNLSRPILKALATLNFQKPTPIQAVTIPAALLGKDVVGNAVTGSGKTAAFMIPILERLLYREKGKNAAATRCVILVPTRELAVQCFDVGTKLAIHTDIRVCLVVGGLSLKSQEVALRSRPDIVIATPGRLIDHIHNSPSFTLDALDVLVLDEADRMLSDGFSDELTEIVKSCPLSRQTMLFSATMTDSVDELVKMSLNKPLRLFVDPKKSTARGLTQEFIRIRSGKESERSAVLAALCQRTFRSNVIIFLRSKKLAHQLRVLFGLLNMKCEELHGDLFQEQRLNALSLFRNGSADILLATDLASRGLDIKGVQTVINYDMPSQLAQYLHRVGRTARAGNKGRSVTLVGEADRKMLKATIKNCSSEDQIRHRVVPQEVILKWAQKIDGLKDEVAAVLQDEKEERQLRKAEMELKKGENIIKHEAEIYSRPARTWFQNQSEKLSAKAISKEQYHLNFSAGAKNKDMNATDGGKPKRDKFSGLSRKAKRRKMVMEEDMKMGDQKAINAAVRSAKKASRPSKITQSNTPKRKGPLKKNPVLSRRKGTFEQDLSTRPGQRGNGSSDSVAPNRMR